MKDEEISLLTYQELQDDLKQLRQKIRYISDCHAYRDDLDDLSAVEQLEWIESKLEELEYSQYGDEL